ncbi:MatE protein [Bacillus sp. OV194]|nr:MatE protein [Bacillus sp. OV194]
MTVMKLMLLFLVPLLFSNIMQSIGQLVGMVIIGRCLGVDSVAAISAFFPLFFLLISFVIGIGSGSSILIGQASIFLNIRALRSEEFGLDIMLPLSQVLHCNMGTTGFHGVTSRLSV